MKKIVSFKFILFDILKLLTVPLGLIWFRPKILYASKQAKIKPTGGALVIANHITFFDPVFLMVPIWYRRFHFIALESFFSSKMKKFFFSKVFMCLPIDRENMSMSSFRTIVSHLKDDELVAMFPEGHINWEEGGVAQFKSGMILMAMQSGKPIIPVYIRKRQTIFSRLVLGVGEPVSIERKEGQILGREEIDHYNIVLHDAEVLLQKLCDEY